MRRSYRHLPLLLFLSVLGALGYLTFAGEGLPIFRAEGGEEYNMDLKVLPYFEDFSGQMPLEEVLALPSGTFAPNPHYALQRHRPASAFWVQIDPKMSKLPWILDFYDQNTDRIDIYMPRYDGGYDSLTMGDNFPFYDRPIVHKNLSFALTEAYDCDKPFLFRIKSHKVIDIRMAIRPQGTFMKYANREYLLLGLYIGLNIALALYNLLIYIAVRDRRYICYILYAIGVGMYGMNSSGLAFQYLWPDNPDINAYNSDVMLFTLAVLRLLFVDRFLLLAHFSKRLHRGIGLTILCCLLIFITRRLDLGYGYSYLTTQLLTSGIALWAGLYVWRMGYKPAGIILLATAMPLIGMLTRWTIFMGWVPFSILGHYSFLATLMLELLLFSFALSERLRMARLRKQLAQKRVIEAQQTQVLLQAEITRELHEKQLAQKSVIEAQQAQAELQEKINRELEEKVAQRTAQLEAKRQKLEEHAHTLEVLNATVQAKNEEIQRINRLLDVDNHQLKNQIVQERGRRFLNEQLSYQEFAELFPDHLACHRYLDRLKWGKGYHCSKCGHDKHCEGVKKFSRRCTRCGYDESVTAGTLFQGLRFPIQKAFFLSYLVSTQPDRYTLQQLSEMLGLHKNTIWAFKKKVAEDPEGHRIEIRGE